MPTTRAPNAATTQQHVWPVTDCRSVCPPGHYSKRLEPSMDHWQCTPCPSGTYKSASLIMRQATECAPKKNTCPMLKSDEQGKIWLGPEVSAVNQTLFKTAVLLAITESTVSDDHACVPHGQCPGGSFLKRVLEGVTECERCPDGQFKLLPSPAPFCQPKTIEECMPGNFLLQGTNPRYDDNVCVACPAGTFEPSRQNSSAPRECTCKKLPQCRSGEAISLGQSAKEDDNKCQTCATGSYMAMDFHQKMACLPKKITKCGAGFYFMPGKSTTADDNYCVPCPPGTYSGFNTTESTCTAKAPLCCTPGQYLHTGASSTTNDNVCIDIGKCPAGHHRSTNTIPIDGVFPVDIGTGGGGSHDCTPCPFGTWQRFPSSAAACKPKAVTECGPGEHVHIGDSRTSDDSVCKLCGVGTFSNKSDALACCYKETLVSSCPPGYHVSSYTSLVVDDSACVPCATPGFFNTGEFSDGDRAQTKSTACKAKKTPSVCRVSSPPSPHRPSLTPCVLFF